VSPTFSISDSLSRWERARVRVSQPAKALFFFQIGAEQQNS